MFLLVPQEVTCKKIKDKINGLLAGMYPGTCPSFALLGIATPAYLLPQHPLTLRRSKKEKTKRVVS